MTDQADAIVVGSGINGMVSAAELARAGSALRCALVTRVAAADSRKEGRVLPP